MPDRVGHHLGYRQLQVVLPLGGYLVGRHLGGVLARNRHSSTRPRRRETRTGELELAIANLRKGSYFPSFLASSLPGVPDL